ncbi:ankyrin repeat-containing domain protein [Armillaria fumosa]|nr:ankyrin repeat-containing domain protein [Armillaria fumosa]
MSNIWIAAGDGDLARVQELVLAGTLPNIPDEFTYTPMHAAASYGHIHILEFLLAHGGDVNITDDDGETPLYVVEDVATARWLVDHGAVIDRTNNEGVSPIESLVEDFPQVAEFLQAETAIRKLD